MSSLLGYTIGMGFGLEGIAYVGIISGMVIYIAQKIEKHAHEMKR